MKMESAVEAQQGVETAVNETESQQITPAQIATLAQVTADDYHRNLNILKKLFCACQKILHLRQLK